MMSRFFKILMMACLLSGAVVVAAPASTDGLTWQLAKSMDVDKDGRITLAEFLNASSDMALFEKIDADGNSVLDADEISKAVKPPYKIRN